MAKQANKNRREPEFGVGDKFFIIKKAWSPTNRPRDKLNFPLTRKSYKIKNMKSYFCELEVPPSWLMSNLFHADRLRKDPDNPLPGQSYIKPDHIVVDGEEEWEIDRILSSRQHHGKLQYMAQWHDWDPDPEYYNADNFKNASTKPREFHNSIPNCEGPPLGLSE